MANIEGVTGRHSAAVTQRQGVVQSTAQNVNTTVNRNVPLINRPAEQQIRQTQNNNMTHEQQFQQTQSPRQRGGVPQARHTGRIDLFA